MWSGLFCPRRPQDTPKEPLPLTFLYTPGSGSGPQDNTRTLRRSFEAPHCLPAHQRRKIESFQTEAPEWSTLGNRAKGGGGRLAVTHWSPRTFLIQHSTLGTDPEESRDDLEETSVPQNSGIVTVKHVNNHVSVGVKGVMGIHRG